MGSSLYDNERGQAIALVARSYQEILCRTLSRFITDDIGYYIDRGLESDLIVKAIEITSVKQLDWRYTKGILNRCIDEGILTAEVFEYRTIFKKVMFEFKNKYSKTCNDENILLPFAIIETARRIGYLDKIQKDLAML